MSTRRKTSQRPAKAGFKYQLTRDLMYDDLSRRDADAVVSAILDSIKSALMKSEEVTVDGFGAWTIVPITDRRAWRFGRVIQRPTREIAFISAPELDQLVAKAARRTKTWRAERKKKDVEDVGNTSSELNGIRVRYERVIRHFLTNELHAENHSLFWQMRDTPWATNEMDRAKKNVVDQVSVEDVQRVIDATAPTDLPRHSPNRSIELACWYIRWTAQLGVDPDLWRQAEYEVRHWGAFQP